MIDSLISRPFNFEMDRKKGRIDSSYLDSFAIDNEVLFWFFEKFLNGIDLKLFLVKRTNPYSSSDF